MIINNPVVRFLFAATTTVRRAFDAGGELTFVASKLASKLEARFRKVQKGLVITHEEDLYTSTSEKNKEILYK